MFQFQLSVGKTSNLSRTALRPTSSTNNGSVIAMNELRDGSESEHLTRRILPVPAVIKLNGEEMQGVFKTADH